jgi:hypothetical protein
MGIKEKIKAAFRREPAVTVDDPAPPVRHIPPRVGMWVMTPDGVGILQGFVPGASNGSAAKVASFNKDGLVSAHRIVDMKDVTVARLNDIPKKKISHLTPEQARRLGYF